MREVEPAAATVSVLAPVVTVPAVNVSAALTVGLCDKVNPLTLFNVRPLNDVFVVPPIVCAPDVLLNVVVWVPDVNVPLFAKLPGFATELPETVRPRLFAFSVVPVAMLTFPLTVAVVFKSTDGVPFAFTVKLGKTFAAPAAAPMSKFGDPVVDVFPNWTVPPVIATVPAADIL